MSPFANVVGRKTALSVLAFVAIAAASFYVRMAIPIVAIPGASHDDALFTDLAYQIQHGQWLGPYTHLTLAKGAGYPLFLALVNSLNVPVKLAEHALYIAAAAALSTIAGLLYRSRRAAIFIFLCLAVNPALWSHGAQRMTRESFYAGLCVAIFAGAAWFLSSSAWRVRWRLRMATALGLGLLIGFFLVTREEGIWIVPSLLVIALGAYAMRRSIAVSEAKSGAPAAQLSGVLALLLIGAGVAPLSLSLLNKNVYGSPLLNDLNAGAYPAAYGAIVSVHPSDRDPRLGFTEDTVRILQQVSPEASILLPHLSTEEGANWRRVTCDELKLAPCPPVIGSAWLLWALRQAASEEGQFKSAAGAQRYFQKIAADLHAACATGRVRCQKLQSGLAPPPRLEYVPRIAHGFHEGLKILWTLGAPNINWLEYPSSTVEEIRFSRVSGPIGSPTKPTEGTLIEGWLASPALASVEIAGAPDSTIKSEQADDVVRHFKVEEGRDVVARRVSVVAKCGAGDCSLVAVDAGGVRNVFNIKDATLGSHKSGEAILFISEAEQASRVYKAIKLDSYNRFADGLENFANLLARIFAVASVFILFELPRALVSILRGRAARPADYLFVACVLAVGVRLGLLSYIDATSFNAITPQYLLPCIPLYLIAVSMAVVGVASQLGRVMRLRAAA